MIGNENNSAIVAYDICASESGGLKMKQAWTLHAADCPSYLLSSMHGMCGKSKHRNPEALSTAEVMDKAAADKMDSGRNYLYVEAFFMAEFNPSGSIFAVKELPYETTVLHLVSPEGRVTKTVDLMAMVGDKEASKRPVSTLFISAYHDGLYAIGVEGGGRIVLVDAELLQLRKSFKVVITCSYCGLNF